MNKREFSDLQPDAAGPLCYRLLNVRVLQDDSPASLIDRAFLEPDAHLLLLSNAHGGRLVVDGRPLTLRPGTLFVCAPGQLIEWTNYTGSSLELLLLDFDVFVPPPAGGVPSAEAAQPRFPVLGESGALSAMAAGHYFGAIGAAWDEGTPSARLRCEAGLLELLSLALGYQEQMTERALEGARLELERHYAEEMTVDALARIAGLSRFHFMRLFKERYGKGVMEYRTELRLQEAKRLMGERGLALPEIAERVGYSSESYFALLFKKMTGLTPAAYQRNRQHRIAAYSWVNFGQLLALGIIPYAAPMDQYWTDYYRTKYGYEVETPLSHQYAFNWNALREARPDRIIGIEPFLPEEEQAKLRELAPCLFLRLEDDWRSHLADVARFMEREGEAQRWLARYDRQAAIVRERLDGAGLGREALLVLDVGRHKLTAWGSRAGTVLYDDLGFAVPPGLDGIDWLAEAEPFGLATLEADRVVVQASSDAAAQARWRALRQSDAWRSLPAVRAGRVHEAPADSVFEAPLNEYAAEPLARQLAGIPRWFGLGEP